MKRTSIILALTVPVFFTACKNPADKTQAATVKDAVEVTANAAGGARYVFTENSTVGFTGSKVTGSHNGGFNKVKGHFSVKEGALSGNDHQVVIEMDSLWADAEKLTGHLKSADFFDVEKYPEATFVATSLNKKSENAYDVSGNFTLHGKTKNITFPATVTENGDLVKIDAKFNINREDFGIVYPGMQDDLIRNEVVIELKLEVKADS